MSPRLFLNVVYAWLLRNAMSAEDREAVDAQLYARADGANDMDRLLLNIEREDGQ